MTAPSVHGAFGPPVSIPQSAPPSVHPFLSGSRLRPAHTETDRRTEHATSVATGRIFAQCLQHKAPQYIVYMMDCCIHTSNIARRQHLRSAGCHQLFVPRHQRSMFGRRAFSVAGPAAWNLLPDYLRDPSRSADSFRLDLKTSFLVLLAFSAHRRLCDYAPYKSTIDTDTDCVHATRPSDNDTAAETVSTNLR